MHLVAYHARHPFALHLAALLGIGVGLCVFAQPAHADTDDDLKKLFSGITKGDTKAVEAVFAGLTPNDAKKLANLRHKGGWTPLHIAVVKHDQMMIHVLLGNGADIDAKDHYVPQVAPSIIEERTNMFHGIRANRRFVGWTPLHYAAALGHADVVELLLSKGADPYIKNEDRQAAEDYVAFSKDSSVKRTILEQFEKAKENRETVLRQKKKEDRIRFPMEEELRVKMVGQVMPILTVSAAMRRKDSGWHDEDKPMVLLFMGSSGVGKTMLGKAIAESVNKDKDAFIRVDMSEYSQKHEVARLIGSPPGYVGHDDGGQLTAKLEKHPNAVVLLDEVEKAHPDVLTLMLQVFDEGRLTDGKGHTIDCPNATFIMTSNLIQDQIRSADAMGYSLRPPPKATKDKDLGTESLRDPELWKVSLSTNKFLRKVVQPILKTHFKRDEFLGRINEMVIFHHFEAHDVEEIVNMELKQWAVKALKRHDVTLTWDDQVVRKLASEFNERYGFRSIKYAVQKEVIDLLAYAHERDQFKNGFHLQLQLQPLTLFDGPSEGEELEGINFKVVSDKPSPSKSWFF